MAKIGKVEAARQEVQPVKGEIEALKHRLDEARRRAGSLQGMKDCGELTRVVMRDLDVAPCKEAARGPRLG